MKIRSITCFINPGWPLDEKRLQGCADLVHTARAAFSEAGYEVQTSRLATPPFSNYLPVLNSEALVRLALALEESAAALGIQYVSLGPAFPNFLPAFEAIPAVLSATSSVFLTGVMADPAHGVSLPAVHCCAEVIKQASSISPDGFANLRFAALANVRPDAPFFPAAFSSSDRPGFALALEAADLAIEAVAHAATLEEARLALVNLVEFHASRLTEVCTALEKSRHFEFKGLDFTLAPYPTEEFSIGTALERLGVPAVGLHGSLAAVAFLTDALDRANFQRTGFNGVFMPVLEDSVLALRAAEGFLGVKDLLLLSAVCGTGLDVVPLPGDISVDQIYALLLDLAVMALRLDKPLTARLMPIPGKRIGDPTGFDFAFFANSRVMPVEARPLAGLLAGNETFKIRSRYRSDSL